MKSLWKLIKQNNLWVFIAVTVTFISVGAELVWTSYVGKLADSIVERTGIAVAFLCMMGALLLGNGLLQYVNQIVNRYASERMAHSLRMNFADGLLSSNSSGEMGGYEAMSKVQNELVQSSEYMSTTLFGIAEMMLSGVFSLAFLLFQNAYLTVIILVPMIIVVIIVNFLGKKLIPLTRKAMDRKVDISQTSYSIIQNYDAVLLFDAKPFFKSKYEKDLEDWAKFEIKKERISAVCNSLTGVLSQVPLLVLFTVGAVFIFKGYMTIGMLIIFLNRTGSLLRTLMNLASWVVSVKSFLVNLTRVDPDFI